MIWVCVRFIICQSLIKDLRKNVTQKSTFEIKVLVALYYLITEGDRTVKTSTNNFMLFHQQRLLGNCVLLSMSSYKIINSKSSFSM